MSVYPREIGDRVERAGLDYYPLERDDEFGGDPPGSGWIDARIADASLSFANPDDPVEIKGCAAKQCNTHSGRWYIRRDNHDRLVDADGHYVLVVYSPSGGVDSIDDPDDVEIERIAIVDARTVDQLIQSRACWIQVRGRSDHAKLPYRHVFQSLDHPNDDTIVDLGRLDK